MSEKRKTEEPIDAEFETLDAAEEDSANKTEKAKPMRIMLPLGIGVLIILVAIASWFFVFSAKPASEISNNGAQFEQLSARLAALEAQVKTRQGQGTATQEEVTKRLNALEKLSGVSDADKQALSDLIEKVMVLENTQPVTFAGSTDIAQKLDRLETQINALNNDTQYNNPSTTDLTNVLDRLGALENAARDGGSVSPLLATRLDTLEAEAAALQTRMATLESGDERAKGAASLALSILALDSTAQTGKPFAREWRALAQVLPQNPDVQTIAPLAITGVAGFASLKRSFEETISAIRATEGENNVEKTGMMRAAKKALGSIISVRRIDDNAKGVDAIIVRAQAALADEDLDGAVQSLGGLEGAAREAAQGWLVQANARLTLEQALARLNAVTAGVNP